MNIKLVLFLSLILLSPLCAQYKRPIVPWEHGKSEAENLKIILITISPGDNLTDWWGHVGLAVQDTAFGITRVYNFGLFSFEEGFIQRFAMGRLIFWAGDASLESVIRRYSSANRTISYQELKIADSEKLALAEKLSYYILPENSHYLYHHYKENCATRLRDFIDESIAGQLKNSTRQRGRLTYRQHTLRYTSHAPLMQWLLMFLMNDSIDKPILQWDEMFLPDELSKYVATVSITDSGRVKTPFVASSGLYYNSKREGVPYTATNWPLWTKFAGIIIALLAVLLAGWKAVFFNMYMALVSFIIGFIGLVLFLMGLFTDHLVTHNNENLFMANPITFLIFIISIVSIFKPSPGKDRIIEKAWMALSAMSVVLLFLKIFPLFNQDNLMIFSILLPVNVGFAYACFKKSRTASK